MKPAAVMCVSAICLLLAGAASAQGNWDDVEIKSTHVGGNVHMIEGRGGNIGVTVGADGILVVDDQFAPLAEKINAALTSLHPGDLKFVINTHFHFDHVGGNPVFGKEATIVAHANVRKRVVAPQKRQDAHPSEPMEKSGWPVVTLDQSLSIHFNGEEIKLMHVPTAHTDGDVMVYFTGANVLHMGDLLFSGMFPFVDIEAGGTIEGYKNNLKAVLDRFSADTKIIPGHGPLSTMDDVRRSHEMIEATVDHVRRQMKEGRTLDSLKEAGLPEEWASFDWHFIGTEDWIETIYTSYSN